MTAEFTLDAARFDDIAGFYQEINRVFMADEDWGLAPSLDALNDLLHGGFGALPGDGPARIVWLDIDKSRRDLGVPATRDWLRAKLDRPGPFDTAAIRDQLAALEAGGGPTYFDILMEIFADHPRIELVAL